MPAQRLLIIEDDPDIARLLTLDLTDHGYQVIHAATAMDGLIQAREQHPDLILLDLGLPDFDGSTVLTRLRASSNVPIIVVTARGSVEEKVQMLTLGADDYVVKPYDERELEARIKVQLRQVEPATLTIGDLVLNPERRQLWFRGIEIPLTPKEFEILLVLATEPGKIFRREDLTQKVWNGELPADSNVIDVHVSNLRNKLRDADGYKVVRTVRGIGYGLHA
ncbi:response regulator transcription factor [Deinococcus hohokamensis]|uniref:Response regulator transcription factor n=1 Tax=Deinococcus hohokamensis TaxID=309883 RepID=A0ABV9IDG8_9DEIO